MLELLRKAKDQLPLLGRPLVGQEGDHNLRAQMVWGSGGTLLLKVLNTALGFGLALLLARLLGPQGYGTFTYALAWTSMLSTFALLGMNTLLVRETARYKALSDWAGLRGLLRWSQRIVLLSSVWVALLFALGVWFFRAALAQDARTALWIAAGLVPVYALLFLKQGAILGLGRVLEGQIPQLLVLPLTFLVEIGVLWALTPTFSGTDAVGMWLVAGLAAGALAVFYMTRALPAEVRRALPQVRSKLWLKSAAPFLFVGLAGIANERIATVIVGSALGTDAAGIFDVALRGALLISFPLFAVNMPLAPIIAGLFARGERHRLQRVLTRSARAAFSGALPLALGLIVFREWVLALFGEAFTQAGGVLIVLSIGQLVNVGLGSVALVLNMTGHEQDTARGVGLAAVLNVVLNLALVPLWGIEGAAVAYTASLVTWNAFLAVRVLRRLALDPTLVGHLTRGAG